ncbi:ThiF family adenylyltransferase, partial [Metallibacterium sp.]|uniref:tRNA threonylcarbamoyladenosine dehydratase n=1 Tax=Metallibacterium sp. TaxID=2940281 RepID=UPI00262C8025
MSELANPRQRFDAVARLYGAAALTRLTASRVAVVGVGGVGSWAAEALARSGIGALRLIGNYGRPKVAVLAERLLAINPGLRLEPVQRFLTVEHMDLLEGCDAVLDACDALAVKVVMAAFCRLRRQPLVTVGSAGGRGDATKVRVR